MIMSKAKKAKFAVIPCCDLGALYGALSSAEKEAKREAECDGEAYYVVQVVCKYTSKREARRSEP